MEEYKESGIDWIGKIPKNWDIQPLGVCFDERREKVSDTLFEPLSVTKKGILKQLDNVAKSDAHDDRKKVCKDDFVINSRSDRKQSCGLSDYDGSVSLINTVLISNKKMLEPIFVKYLLDNCMFAEEFYRNGHGIVADLWTTNYTEMKRIYIPIPSKREQKQIADFLDEKVGKIDKILEDLNKQIEILKKYRNNIIYESTTYGIENTADLIYTDNIFYKKTHKNWHLVALKRLTKVLTCGVASTPEYTDKDNGILFLSAQNIQNNKLDLSTKNYIPSELHKKITKYTKPQYGDVLQVRVGATIGKSAIVDIKDEFSIYVSLTLMRVNEKINNKYLNYVISTDQFKQMVSLDVDFAGSQGNLNVGDLKETKIPLPDYKEQIKIINYLDEKCSNIDKTIQIKQKQIDKLENYKKSLIYEYVTGKKRVKEE